MAVSWRKGKKKEKGKKKTKIFLQKGIPGSCRHSFKLSLALAALPPTLFIRYSRVEETVPLVAVPNPSQKEWLTNTIIVFVPLPACRCPETHNMCHAVSVSVVVFFPGVHQ